MRDLLNPRQKQILKCVDIKKNDVESFLKREKLVRTLNNNR
jgi:hypothetical protein